MAGKLTSDLTTGALHVDRMDYAAVKYNVWAFGKDVQYYERKLSAARAEHSKKKWARALEDSQWALERNRFRLQLFAQ